MYRSDELDVPSDGTFEMDLWNIFTGHVEEKLARYPASMHRRALQAICSLRNRIDAMVVYGPSPTGLLGDEWEDIFAINFLAIQGCFIVLDINTDRTPYAEKREAFVVIRDGRWMKIPTPSRGKGPSAGLDIATIVIDARPRASSGRSATTDRWALNLGQPEVELCSIFSAAWQHSLDDLPGVPSGMCAAAVGQHKLLDCWLAFAATVASELGSSVYDSTIYLRPLREEVVHDKVSATIAMAPLSATLNGQPVVELCSIFGAAWQHSLDDLPGVPSSMRAAAVGQHRLLDCWLAFAATVASELGSSVYDGTIYLRPLREEVVHDKVSAAIAMVPSSATLNWNNGSVSMTPVADGLHKASIGNEWAPLM
ncbi:hypothetical protein VPG91_22605 [Nitrospirillum amazonense]|uniref:hypothetical protein n=1 Tax=Nitrospirillum amazonense TaxID=28077 RepID=UPI002DD43324|nr:hypothetical protein [Nitrospirillum amazonense]MEC4593809.1 hypothetical protein [Nitrospirillum amazonense]